MLHARPAGGGRMSRDYTESLPCPPWDRSRRRGSGRPWSLGGLLVRLAGARLRSLAEQSELCWRSGAGRHGNSASAPLERSGV